MLVTVAFWQPQGLLSVPQMLEFEVNSQGFIWGFNFSTPPFFPLPLLRGFISCWSLHTSCMKLLSAFQPLGILAAFQNRGI